MLFAGFDPPTFSNMASRNRQAGTYLFAEDTSDTGTDYETAKQRHATVYDAVAGMSRFDPVL